MNSKHLSTGSQCPPLQDGVLRIYSMRFCPFAQRPILVARAKGIQFEIVNCNLRQKPEWLLKKNPLGKIPTIEIIGKEQPLYESLIICDYIDETYPGKSLHSKDTFQKALDRIWLEKFNTIIGLYYKSAYNCTEIEANKILPELENAFKSFETELENRKGQLFFGGLDTPGMMDYMIWPWMERLPALSKLYPSIFDFNKFLTTFLNLGKWIERMKKDPVVEQFYLDPNHHYEYFQTSKNITPNYELLHQK